MANLNFIQRFLVWLGNVPLEREIVYPLEKQLVERDKKIEVLVKRVNTVEAQLAERIAQDREKKEKTKKKDKDQEIAQELVEEEYKLNRKKVGETFSLNSFFMKLYGIKKAKNSSEYDYRSKFGKKLEIADKNDETSQKFGELLISEKGFFIITDSEGEPRIISPDLKRLIHKPESLFNQIKRGRILLANDKDGKYIPEIDDVEVEVPLYNEETMEYELSEELREKARDIIIQKDIEVRNKENKIEQLEIVVSNLKRDLRDITRTKKLYESNSNVSQTELSKAMEVILETGKKFSEMHKNIINLTESKAMGEEKGKILEGIISTLLEKLEQTGDKTEFEKAMALIKDSFEFTSSNIQVPEVINVVKEGESKMIEKQGLPMEGIKNARK